MEITKLKITTLCGELELSVYESIFTIDLYKYRVLQFELPTSLLKVSKDFWVNLCESASEKLPSFTKEDIMKYISLFIDKNISIGVSTTTLKYLVYLSEDILDTWVKYIDLSKSPIIGMTFEDIPSPIEDMDMNVKSIAIKDDEYVLYMGISEKKSNPDIETRLTELGWIKEQHN